MTNLVLAAAFFVSIHVGLSATGLRDAVVARTGENAYRIAFSIASVAGIVWLVQAYATAPFRFLWVLPPAFNWVVAAAMLVATLFVVVGLTTPSPTAAGFERVIERPDVARGILRVTRHPFLWGTAIWASAHLVVNGDTRSLVLFGSLLLVAVMGTRSIDRKRRRRYGASWEQFAASTSNVPFLAIRDGRNAFRPGEIGLWRLALAIAVFGVLIHFHPQWFGVSPLPM
jgi:uncharacterized membrane protein